MTKKELATRADELQHQQQAASARIAAQAAEEKKDVSAVSGEVGSVKTDVGGVKTDVAATKASLEATIAKLQGTIGDLGVQSGLIANTRTDLEALKHKGDRQYYEFALGKNDKPKAFSTVALQLKKTDPKHGKYSLNVTADDKTIEKKDKTRTSPSSSIPDAITCSMNSLSGPWTRTRSPATSARRKMRPSRSRQRRSSCDDRNEVKGQIAEVRIYRTHGGRRSCGFTSAI